MTRADIIAEFRPYAYPATKERGRIAAEFGIEAMADEILKLRDELAKSKPIVDAAVADCKAWRDLRSSGAERFLAWEAMHAAVHAAYPELGRTEGA